MYEHLRTWTNYPTTSVSMRLDLWDTGRTRDGKSELRYAFYLQDGRDAAIFEGEDFWPSPLHAIDSDTAAAGLLGFLGYDGESLAFDHGEPADCAERYTQKQRELLANNHELIGLWSYELANEEEGE